jgi:hypothetical protein
MRGVLDGTTELPRSGVDLVDALSGTADQSLCAAESGSVVAVRGRRKAAQRRTDDERAGREAAQRRVEALEALEPRSVGCDRGGRCDRRLIPRSRGWPWMTMPGSSSARS